MARSNRPRGAPQNPVRSVRVDTMTWEKAARRARGEGLTMSEVLYRFVKGYADGMLNAPTVRVVYAAPPPAQPEL